ncbi:MAG: protein phosphatase CheZ [Rhodocyclaceae bacterium]|nr:protein phosphatase CheZ [Rhodocyclaceae bacterium]
MNPYHVSVAGRDSAELQALFDSVAGRAAPPSSPDGAAERTFNRVGQIMRQLNDALRELGYDRLIERTAQSMPDTRDRLAYIASLTEQAASRVLNATDVAMPLQEELSAGARALGARWRELYANRLSVAEFRALADDTVAYLEQRVPAHTAATGEQLMNIILAQDFQDLTGQVIKKIVALAQGLETQLMTVLVDLLPEERRSAEVDGLLNGPAIGTAADGDAAVSQAQVDDLLNSLGF